MGHVRLTSALAYFRTTRGQVVIALLTSLVVAALSVLFFKDAIPVLPALLVAVWTPVYAGPQPTARRLMVTLTGGLALLAGIGVLVFVLIGT